MHDETAEGNDYFKCDFCMRSWSEDLPMVEGHRGSLICAECLETACREVLVLDAGVPHEQVTDCTLCLMHREEPYWLSPTDLDARACRWCIDKSASMLEKDPEFNWKRPTRES